MKSPMTPDDPRLTAYALGELSPSERPEIEAALRDSAECRAAVSEIRQVAESLQVGLGAEPCPQLSPERKESVLRAVPAPEPSAHRSPSTPGWWMLWGPRLGWGVAGGEGTNPLRAQLATWNPERGLGTANRGRYSNPAFDALLDKAMVTMDTGARDALVKQATQLAMDDVPVIMLHLQKNIWATRKGLTYRARVDEETRATDVMEVK